MGISLNIDTNNENEFNQQLQMYLAQGYSMQSNFNGTAILKKKSYSMGLLIVLIIFFFPAAIIYYLVSSDDIDCTFCVLFVLAPVLTSVFNTFPIISCLYSE